MTTITEGNRQGDLVLFEEDDHYSRRVVTIASGAALTVGAVLGMVTLDVADITAAAAAGNTGNGALTLATPAYGAGVKPGVYVLTCIEPAADAGKFQIVDPDGVVLGVATVAVAYDGVVKFTIADGGTDFVAGDIFRITVAEGNGKYNLSDPAAADGSQTPAAVLLTDAEAASADVTDAVALVRHARVQRSALVFHEDVDDATKRQAAVDALAEVGILTDA